MIKTITMAALLLVGMMAHAEPPAGHPSVGQAQGYLQVPEAESLPHQGQVLQSIPSNDYVYLQVTKVDGGTRWLAAPREKVTVQSYIRYSDGTVMQNFYSRKHKRTFNEVMFVKRIQQLGN